MQQAKLSATLRPATPDDDDFLLRLFSSARPELSMLNLEDSQKQLLIKMQFNAQRQQYDASYPQAENSIILCGECAVGRMLVSRNDREITLIDIALLPENQNAGIGTSLISKLLIEATGSSKIVRLHVLNSSPAKHLYERLGFSSVEPASVYSEMVWRPL